MGHWETVTFIAGLRQTGIVAPMLIKGAMNGEAFLAYIEQCLVPTLKRRDVVVVDNVPFHKVAGVEDAIQAVGASLRYLPKYSPDLNPIVSVSKLLESIESFGFKEGWSDSRRIAQCGRLRTDRDTIVII
jgi:transposase